MTKGLISFFQHSNTPTLQYSKVETFYNFWQPLYYLFIGYNSAIPIPNSPFFLESRIH